MFYSIPILKILFVIEMVNFKAIFVVNTEALFMK
jgi:hypothetical protein